MENKKIINILAISGMIVLFIAFLFEFKCIFKSITNIPCISCGLTRGFRYILNGDLVSATKMNILSVPILIVIIFFYILYIIWLLFKKDYIFKFYNYFVYNYKLVIFVLIICWFINIFK